MLKKLKKLLTKQTQQNNSLQEVYAIFRYDEDVGKWKKASQDFPTYISPEDADFPEEGIYQLRMLYPRMKKLWTVEYKDGEVYNVDPRELQSSSRRSSNNNADPQQMMQVMMQTMQQTITPTLQFLKMQKELLEQMGLIKDPKKELLETMTMIKELKEIQNGLKEVIGGDEEKKPEFKLPENAPWFIYLTPLITEALSTLKQAQQMQLHQNAQYMQQQSMQQQLEPQQQTNVELNLPSIDELFSQQNTTSSIELPNLEDNQKSSNNNDSTKELDDLQEDDEEVNEVKKYEPKENNDFDDIDLDTAKKELESLVKIDEVE